MFKIKSGELKPQTGFVASRSGRQEEKNSTAPLAALGIEFGVAPGAKAPDMKLPQTPRPPINTPSKPNTPNGTSSSPIQKPNNFKPAHTMVERKHSGPSPLLRGLLQKIGIENNNSKTKEPEIKTVAPKQEPVSLSTLKKPEHSVVAPVIPTKEASEEKKASLKDLLARATAPQVAKAEPVKEPVLAKIEDKKEEVKIEAKPELKIESKPEVKVESKPPVATPDPVPVVSQPVQASTPPAKVITEEKVDKWQKPKAKKEVPEDVLRKVLE